MTCGDYGAFLFEATAFLTFRAKIAGCSFGAFFFEALRMPHKVSIPSKKCLTQTQNFGSIDSPVLMNKYYLQNIQHKIENGKNTMLVVLYRDDELISKEWVVSNEDGQCWEFCQNMTMGNHFAFDVLADVKGEDRAAWIIDEWCFDPCWDEPGVKIDITPEDYLAARSCMCG